MLGFVTHMGGVWQRQTRRGCGTKAPFCKRGRAGKAHAAKPAAGWRAGCPSPSD